MQTQKAACLPECKPQARSIQTTQSQSARDEAALFVSSNFKTCLEYATKANIFTINEKFKEIKTNENALVATPFTLRIIANCFSVDEAYMFIEPWIINLGEYINKGALSSEQIQETSILFFENASMLNLCELNLFFKRVKSAKYGAFYTFDGQSLMAMLNQFLGDRQKAAQRLIVEESKDTGRLDIRGSVIASMYANRLKEKEAKK
jgi:hypothetical protein